MALERAPVAPLPVGHVPQGGVAYKVKDGDSFVSVAKANGLDPMALIEFNFKTRDPREINWYLRRNVGCTRQTADRNNYLFAATDSPGIVYLPPRGTAAPGPVLAPPPAPVLTNLWFGIGVKGGGHFVAIGKEAFEGMVWSADRFENRFQLEVDAWRVGPGLGAATGFSIAFVTGLRDPNLLRGEVVSGVDFQLAGGAKLSGAVKALAKLPWVVRMARQWKHAKTAGRATLTLMEWEKTRESVKQILVASGISLDPPTPQVTILDVPFAGVGLEASAYWGFGFVQVSHVHFTDPVKAAAAPTAK